MVGVRITPQTYARLGEYATLIDVHRAWEEGGDADAKMFTSAAGPLESLRAGEDGYLMPESELTLILRRAQNAPPGVRTCKRDRRGWHRSPSDHSRRRQGEP